MPNPLRPHSYPFAAAERREWRRERKSVSGKISGAPVCEIQGLHGTSSGHLQRHKCGKSGHRRRTAGADDHTHLWPRAREQ